MRQSLALEALVEMPAHVECVGFFTQCKNITDYEIVFLQAHGIAQQLLWSIGYISQCRLFRAQAFAHEAVDTRMGEVFQQTNGILLLKISDDKVFCFNNHKSPILAAKIFHTQFADNRHAVETEKNIYKTAKMASEMSL